MPPHRAKLLSRIALLVFTAVCGVSLLRLDFGQKISIDALELLPAAEHSREAVLVRSLAGDVHARVMLFVLSGASADPAAAAGAFVAALRDSGQFSDVLVMGETAANDELARRVFARRFELLLPTWLAHEEQAFADSGQSADAWPRWLAGRAASNLDAFLQRPEALGLQELLLADPLLLTPALIATWQSAAPSTDLANEVRVWATIRSSPFSESGQQPVFAAIEAALAAARRLEPALALQWTGVNRFAATSRDRIRSEVAVLNAASLLAVLGVAACFLRRPWQLLHFAPVIGLALLGAWTAALLAFDRIHVLVFVIGALLAGVSIDYGFYLALQPLEANETYPRKLRRLLRPLLASCLTTVLGFSFLLASELPLLRHIGGFVAVGLVCALAVAMLYVGQLRRPYIESRPPRWLDAGQVPCRAAIALLVVAVLVALAAPWRTTWRDDIRDLEVAAVDLRENDRRIRGHFGEASTRSAYLTYGATFAEAREHLEQALGQLSSQDHAAGVVSLATVLPTAENWAALPARLERLRGFAEELRAALEARGFDAEAFAPFFRAWAALVAQPPAGSYEALAAGLVPHLRGPLALLLGGDAERRWFVSLVPPDAALVDRVATNTVPVAQLASLNELFARYRGSALRLSLAGLGLVIGSVFVIYRGRTALRIASLPIGACCFVFGAFALLGQPLNLFHLLGAFLGVCLSHNYAIFSAPTAAAGQLPPTAVRLSAFTTAASFGVLGFSQIPVIHALGTTVAGIVLTTLGAIEIEARALRSRTP